jgi:hypothetical protein
MKVSAATSRRLVKLYDRLAPDSMAELSQHILNGGDRELWLLKHEKQLQGNRVLKEGI